MSSQSQTYRYFVVDLLRSFAIIGMVIYHFIFDLYFFRATSLDPFSLPLILLARATATLFLFLVGFSFFLSQQRYSTTDLFHHTLKRSLTLFGWASLITLVTFLLDPELMVRSGILNLISISLLLLIPLSLSSSPPLLFLLGLFILILGFFLPSPTTPAFDYFPVFPWFGVIIFGYGSATKWSDKLSTRPAPESLSWIHPVSRHSLAIYLLHQPFLIALLTLFK